MKTVVIAGAGTMGASLAQVYSRAGWNTVLYNRSEKGLERAERLIALNQDTMIREGLLTEEDARQMSRCLSMTTEKAAFAQADLVVENIKEDMEVKKEFWEETSRMTKESALLATNTSGLSITEIARAVWKPQRFMGQHWLNPPHLLPLCEIVIGQQTSWENAQSMRALLKEMGKQPVVVKDIRGFIINRIQFALLREALYIVESGIADPKDVDTCLMYSFCPRYTSIGIFEHFDNGGLDLNINVCNTVFPDLSDAKSAPKSITDRIAAGKLGAKTGEGFYDWRGVDMDAYRERVNAPYWHFIDWDMPKE